MRPRLNPSLPPAFHELGEYPFQEFCCDLFAEEESIATCEIYGTRGQAQRGIDLIARRHDGGSEVAQCKCYEELEPATIREASDEFFRHLSFWQARHTKRFVLIAACPLDRTQQQDALEIEKARFAKHDIAYESWSARTLRHKSRPYREIVERHIKSSEIVEHICGSLTMSSATLPVSAANLVISLDAAGSRIAQLSTRLSREKAVQVDNARAMNRRGDKAAALALLESIRSEGMSRKLLIL